MSNNSIQFCNQAASSPIDSLDSFHQYFAILQKQVMWEHIGILSDEGDKNTIILLSNNNEVVATLRVCLKPNDAVTCLAILSTSINSFTYRVIQGAQIQQCDLLSLNSITKVWVKAQEQTCQLQQDEIIDLFIRFEDKRKKIGRGPDFTVETKRTVWQESYGRCMFTGCGERLDHDGLSGKTGNYAYLAHNVSLTALMDPPMFALMDPLLGGKRAPQTG